MMLKKQTVWLLTMLSLIIVLSVYYMTSPGTTPPGQMAFDPKEEQTSGEEGTSDKSNSAGEQAGTAATNISGEAAFAAARLRMQEARSELKAKYVDVIASETATAEEKAEAKRKIDQLQQLSSTEKMLESLIIARGYKDALVNANGHEVQVIVKSDHLSNKQTVEIMQLVNSKLNQARQIAVTWKPGNSE